jgi:uncharacterized membrane protein
MKKIIFTVMLIFTFNGESQAILHLISDVQKEEKIIHDNNLSEIIGGLKFMDGFCVAVGAAGVAAYFFSPLAGPATVAGAACTVYGIYTLFG